MSGASHEGGRNKDWRVFQVLFYIIWRRTSHTVVTDADIIYHLLHDLFMASIPPKPQHLSALYFISFHPIIFVAHLDLPQPQCVELRVAQDGLRQQGAVQGGVGVHGPQDLMELGSDGCRLLLILAHNTAEDQEKKGGSPVWGGGMRLTEARNALE